MSIRKPSCDSSNINKKKIVDVIVKYPMYSSFGKIKHGKFISKMTIPDLDFHNMIDSNLKYGNFDHCQKPLYASKPLWMLIRDSDVLRDSVLGIYSNEYLKNNVTIETKPIENVVKFVFNDPINKIYNSWVLI